MIVLCMYAHGKVPPGVCWRQAIFGRLAARPSPPLQHAHLFQPPQPFSKQRARDMRKTALKLIEVIHVARSSRTIRTVQRSAKIFAARATHTSAPSFAAN